MDPKEIGRKLRELRGIRTQVGVARETGIGATALANYENGLRVPTDKHKIILARYYNTTVGKLFFGEGNHRTR